MSFSRKILRVFVVRKCDLAWATLGQHHCGCALSLGQRQPESRNFWP
jgi:hypothetical protein